MDRRERETLKVLDSNIGPPNVFFICQNIPGQKVQSAGIFFNNCPHHSKPVSETNIWIRKISLNKIIHLATSFTQVETLTTILINVIRLLTRPRLYINKLKCAIYNNCSIQLHGFPSPLFIIYLRFKFTNQGLVNPFKKYFVLHPSRFSGLSRLNLSLLGRRIWLI
eukprot:TRINITY_DN13666_c0_g6_i2.p1 TRINITY_DN13666_c0_g6~~TRINITY_DN13666_c0_g6_i2.p1  ORF type:complete len:166 (+),score=9.74 TRINITY_DN13666_c0_g6_i2:69-566(+)